MQAIAAEMSPAQRQALETLGTYTYKMRPGIGRYALDAFNLREDPRQGLRDILRIDLQPRPGARNSRRAFTVVDINICPITSFGERTNEIQEMATYHFDEGIRAGGIGGVVVLLVNVEIGICQAFSVGFSQSVAERPRLLHWKRCLTDCINEGHIL